MNRSVLEAIVGIALLSAMDALIKALVGHVPVVEIAFCRYAVGSVIMVLVAAAARPGLPSAETLRANGLRAVLVVITALSFFYALGQLPLAETLVLSFISPAVTAALAALVLGERIARPVVAALLAGFAGVLVIVLFGLGDHAATGSGHVLFGVAAVLVSAVGYSASNVLLRARAQRDPVVTIVLIQNLAPAAMLAAPAAWFWVAPAGGDLAPIGFVGLLGVAGHLVLARAYAGAEATRLAPLDYTALVWAVLFGLVAFGEVPGPAVGAGAVLILGSAWLVARR